MEYLINVTQEDINNGKSGSPWSCPIALAGKRVFGNSFTWGYSSGHTQDGGPLKTYIALTNDAPDFVNRFDKRLPVEPFSFAVC